MPRTSSVQPRPLVGWPTKYNMVAKLHDGRSSNKGYWTTLIVITHCCVSFARSAVERSLDKLAFMARFHISRTSSESTLPSSFRSNDVITSSSIFE